jgi:hypothetical protein
MSQYPATRSASTTSSSTSSGIDLKTLFITAVSSAAAAYATSKIWAPGTLAAAAFTPVMVAVIREGLAKSTDVVTKVVPVKGVVRSARPEGPAAPTADAASGDWSAADLIAAEPPPPGALLAGDPAARVPQPGEIAYHRAAVGRRARNWRVAIVTGLLGFLVAAVVFTVPELVAGSSASGGGRDTTIFGGNHRSSATPAVTTTTETTPTETTSVQTVPTVTQPAVTVPPQTVTTPEPATPQQANPAPTTTVPPPVAEPPPAVVPPG